MEVLELIVGCLFDRKCQRLGPSWKMVMQLFLAAVHARRSWAASCSHWTRLPASLLRQRLHPISRSTCTCITHHTPSLSPFHAHLPSPNLKVRGILAAQFPHHGLWKVPAPKTWCRQAQNLPTNPNISSPKRDKHHY
jgi:hypothetical protein